MIQRTAKDKLKDLASKFKAVAVIGARQTGKTILSLLGGKKGRLLNAISLSGIMLFLFFVM